MGILPDQIRIVLLCILVNIQGIIMARCYGPAVCTDNLILPVIKIQGNHPIGGVKAFHGNVIGLPVILVPQQGNGFLLL